MSATPNTPAPVAPAQTPVNLAEANLTEVLKARPAFDSLKALTLAKLADIARQAVDKDTRLKEDRKAFNGNAKVFGKVIAALKVRYAEAVDAGFLARGTSFAAYHKEVAKGPVNNHAEACANLFNALVVTQPQRLTEAEYDLCATDWLEKASAILSALTKQGKTLDGDEAKRLVAILKARSADTAAKDLRHLKQALLGEKDNEVKTDDGSTVVDYSPKLLVALLRRAFEENHHGFVVSAMTDEISEIASRNRNAATLRDFYTGTVYGLVNAWNASGLSDETWATWESEWAKANEPLQFFGAAAPTAPATPDFGQWARAAYPAANAEEITVAVEMTAAFHRANGRLPNAASELDAYAEATLAAAA